MEIVRFTYKGKVRGQGRPRFRRNGAAYETKEDRNYKLALRAAYLAQTNGATFRDRPVAVYIDVYRALPKSRPKRVEFEPDTMKPDGDNIAKAVLDALNGLAFNDDAQVVALRVTKHNRIRRTADFLTVTIKDRTKEH